MKTRARFIFNRENTNEEEFLQIYRPKSGGADLGGGGGDLGVLVSCDYT